MLSAHAQEDIEVDGAPRVGVRGMLIGLDESVRQAVVDGLLHAGITPDLATDDLHWTLRCLESDNRYAFAVVDADALGGDFAGFVEDLRFALPQLRLVVRCGADGGGERSELAGPESASVRDQSPEALVAATVAAVTTHQYDRGAVCALSASLPTVLADSGWPLQASAQAPFLRASAQALAPVSAMIDVGGADLWGRVVVGSHARAARRFTEVVRGRSPRSREEVWDTLGELSNLVGAEVRRHYRGRGLESHQSPPTILEGERVLVRQMNAPFSLVVPYRFEGHNEPTFVEWILAGKVADRPRAVSEPPASEAALFFDD